MGPGIFDVNTAYIGYQTENFHTNAQYCQGTLIVSNTGVFKVNGTMTLGYTTEDPTNTASTSFNNRGTVTIGAGGTVMASNITVGGVTKLSTGNAITIATNGNLIVSNSVAGPDKMLDSLTLNGGAIVTLHLDLNNPNPYIYVTNLNTTGSNIIQIASIKNLGALSGNIRLVQYSGGNGSFQGLIMPPGLGGALITTLNSTIYLSVLTNAPKDLIWRGYASQNWNLSDANWLDRATGLHTNFSNGDRLTFDDDGSTPTTVFLTGPIDLVPGNIAVSNNVNHYVFANGGGDIQGSATMAEWGNAGVQIDGSTTLTVQLNAGTLTGGGSIGSAIVAVGTTMNFSGNIGAGLAVAGTATVSGNSGGTLSLLGTGVFTNAGTYSGSFNTAGGALLVNNNFWVNGGNPTVVSNATMINNGGFHALTLTIGGKLIDTGLDGIYMNGDVVSGTRGLTINLGGIFVPGGDGIGTTKVYKESGSPNNFPGRLLFSTGSTNVFKVDPSGPFNTMVNPYVMGFGPNQNTKQVNGGTIVITNVSATPFAAGQSFTLFQNSDGGGPVFDALLNTTNSYPIMSPAAPGPGLVWDLSNLIDNGIISIHATGVNPFNAGASFSQVFNLVQTNITSTSTNITTNNYVITHITWPATNIGWSLQEQVNPISIGLSTNWQQVFGSFWTNEMYITNIMTTNCGFYRLVYP
jgi:hypothetical protein